MNIAILVLVTFTFTLVSVSTGQNDCYTGKGRKYTGVISKTKSGLKCQRWDVSTPHRPSSKTKLDKNYPEGSRSKANNHCRNPDNSRKPWCYTVEKKRWEYCDVPKCQEKNECTDGSAVCDVNAKCTDTAASYTCQCKNGYSGNGKSCTATCSPACIHGTCTAPNKCTCQAGFTGANCGQAVDKDECATSANGNADCDANAACYNTVGSYVCKCKPGYCGDGKSCAATCSPACTHGTCAAPNTCTCQAGWSGASCSQAICSPVCTHGSCTAPNTCTCQDGWSGATCGKDVDECASGSAGCDANASCTNTIGGYKCECKAGYSGDGKSCTVIDKDECAESANGNADCHANAKCINIVGSYKCQCKTGYSGDGKTCAASCSPACAHGSCTAPNTCACSAGWTGASCSQDKNECTSHRACHRNADCTNTHGSYTCKCKSGYQGDGRHNCKSCYGKFTYQGHNHQYWNSGVSTPQECQRRCQRDGRCNYFTWSDRGGGCWLKNRNIDPVSCSDCQAGPKHGCFHGHGE